MVAADAPHCLTPQLGFPTLNVIAWLSSKDTQCCKNIFIIDSSGYMNLLRSKCITLAVGDVRWCQQDDSQCQSLARHCKRRPRITMKLLQIIGEKGT